MFVKARCKSVSVERGDSQSSTHSERMPSPSKLLEATILVAKVKPKLQSKANARKAVQVSGSKGTSRAKVVPKSLSIPKGHGNSVSSSGTPPRSSRSPVKRSVRPKEHCGTKEHKRRASIPHKEEARPKSVLTKKKPILVRTNSTPVVNSKFASDHLRAQGGLSSSIDNIKPQSPGIEEPVKISKSVRIDESVQICPIQGRSQGRRRPLLRRSLSFESSDSNDPESVRKKKFKGILPRRRFSQSAIEPIRELLSEIEIQESEKRAKTKASKIDDNILHGLDITDESFRKLSREQQLDILKARSELSAESRGRDWVGLRSLTGANASGWKFQDSFYGNFNVGRRPSMDTAWGRRVYDQYEIECPDNKPKNKYLGDEGLNKEPKELGLWDLIFNPEIISKLEGVQKWDPLYEDKLKEIKKLKIDPTRLLEEVVISDEGDPLNQFKLKFMQTGEYLRPHDMKYCIEKTNFTEEQIIDWFKRFKRDCPDGKLTRDNLRSLFRQAFPDGQAERFTKHVMRIFDSDGNDFLDFKEFLMAMDIATCDTEESKLAWAFKLFDYDNSGCIDVGEMIAIMETLDSLEGNKIKKKVIIDDMGLPDPVLSPEERAHDLFEALDKDGNGVLTMEEFINGYLERNELIAKQDAQEQKRKLNCLIFRGPAVPEDEEGILKEDKAIFTIAVLISKRAGVECESEDIDFVSIRPGNEENTKSAFVRFSDKDMRFKVWNNRLFAKKNGLQMEEYLTVYRQKLLLKCKDLKEQKLIKDVQTKNGDIYAILLQKDPESPKEYEKMLVVTDSHFEALMKATKGQKVGHENP